MDQTTEETVNKDTQTLRMTKGFSLKPNAIQHYYLTIMHNLRNMVNSNSSDSGYDHPYLHRPRMSKDESMCELLISRWKTPI